MITPAGQKHNSMYEAAAVAADKLDGLPGGKKAAEDVRRLIRSHRAVVNTASQQSAELVALRETTKTGRAEIRARLATIREQIARIEQGPKK